MFRIRAFVLFICLFTCLFICLFICLSTCFHFHFHLFPFISFLSICIVLFHFHFHFPFKNLEREKGNQTRPHQTTPTYVLNFPSFVCVCMKRRRQGKKKPPSSRPELLQKSGNVLVLGMQQQRLTVRRTGRGGMISRGLRTPEVYLHTLYSRIRIGKSMERVTTYFQRG